MRTINTSDYFDANLLDGKSGKVSADQSKVRFGDLCVDLTGGFSTSSINEDGSLDRDPDEAKNSFLKEFPASAPVTASVMRNSGENGELYWMLVITTPIPKKKIIKGSSKLNYLTVLGCGTVD